MKNTWILLVLAFGLGAGSLSAQQRMQYSQYLTNAYLQNPAFAGMEDYGDLRLGYSHQWAGFEGAPRGLFLTGHTRIHSSEPTQSVTSTTSLPAPARGQYQPTEATSTSTTSRPPGLKIGVGGTVYSEQTGPISYNGVSAGFSTHILMVPKRVVYVSVGGNVELMNYRVNPNEVSLTDANDIAVMGAMTNLFLPGLNAGVSVYNDRFFLSAATRQLLRNRIQINPNNPFLSRLAVHYHFMAGYRISLNESTKLIPTAALRYVDPAPASWEIGARIDFKDNFQLGASYRHQDAIVVLIGLKLWEEFTLLYSYDFTTSNLRNQSAGTHGISLGYRLQKGGGKPMRRYFW